MKANFIYDHSKRMWSKHYSTCCGAPLKQKKIYKNKVVKDPSFKIAQTTTEYIRHRRKWWRLWRPKTTTEEEPKITTTYKNVHYRYFCTACGKQNNGKWEFLHEDNSPKLNPNKGVSVGQGLVSKTKSAGSTPATPARKD